MRAAREKAEKAAEAKTVKEEEELSRFDKHPRWQQREAKLREAEVKLAAIEAENRILKEIRTTPTERTPATPAYRDITTWSDDEIKAALEDNPKAFAANLYLQIKAEVERDVQAGMAAKSTEQKVAETYNSFRADHPDFQGKWDNGDIRTYMDTHPGHNAMSAYLEMTLPQRIEAETKKATEEAKKRAEADLKAKRKATTLSGSSSGLPDTDANDALKDTKKSGGLNTVIADKLRAMRRAAGS